MRQLARQEVIKLLSILRGVMSGLLNNRVFNQFLDWFHPGYLSLVMEGTLNAFYEDDEVVHCCINFLTEFVSNRSNRMRFDTWNINGLVVFKESAKYIIKLLQLWDSLNSKTTKDLYTGKYKYTKQICKFYRQVVSGNYINFAICEYYSDDVFTNLSQLVVKMIACTDFTQL
jgi:exportin-7